MLRWAGLAIALITIAIMAATCTSRPPEPEIIPPEPFPPVGRDPLGIVPVGGEAMSFRATDTASYSQRDPQWTDIPLGETEASLGGEGCLVTSLAMGMSNLGHEITPEGLNAALIENDGYTDEGWVIWSAIPKITGQDLVADVHGEPSHAQIDRCLTEKDGYPMVKFMLRGQIQHWAIVIGKEDQSWLIRDPLSVRDAPMVLEARAPKIRSVRCLRKR